MGLSVFVNTKRNITTQLFLGFRVSISFQGTSRVVKPLEESKQGGFNFEFDLPVA